MKYFFFFILMIVASNFIPRIGFEVFHFQTEYKEFEGLVTPAKGASLKSLEVVFEDFKSSHPQHKDLSLCRTFKKPCWKFWIWGAYLFNPVWKYPYCERN